MQPTNVLVIDDSKLITKLTTKALLSNNIDNHYFEADKIHIASDGMEAFEMLGKHPDINLIISDVNMPELNGDELVEILIDTQKINDLEVVFMTTKNIADAICPNTKKYTLGTIHKPFNNITFSEKFNEIQSLKVEKEKQREKTKTALNKQKQLVLSWIKEYFHKSGLTISTELLLPLLDAEFDQENVIEESELSMVLSSMVEMYFASAADEHQIDHCILDDIYATWATPDDVIETSLTDDFEAIVSLAGELVSEKPTFSDAVSQLADPLKKSVIGVLKKAKSKQSLPYDDFVPYFSPLSDIFHGISSNFQQKRITLLINRIHDLQKSRLWLLDFVNSGKLFKIFPFLEEDPDSTVILNNKLLLLAKQIKNDVIPRYVHETNTTLWKKAKKTPQIITFLKQNLKGKIPNTHNLLFYFDKINKQEMKRFEKYSREKVVILATDFDLLHLFKDTFQEELPLWEMLAFSKIQMLQSRIDKSIPDRLIIDLSFSDPVFKNGLQLLSFLQKKHPNISKIIDNDGLYFIASPKQVELLRQKKDLPNHKIILKPLNHKNIYDRIIWEA